MVFYQAHWARLVAALTLTLPPGEDAEDVAQEAFTRAFRHWERVHSYERPDAWLFVTANRLNVDLWRRLAVARRKDRLAKLGHRKDEVAPASIEDLLAGLTRQQRAALLLRHYYGLSTRETARALRCRDGTVKSLLARGRSAIRSASQTEDQV